MWRRAWRDKILPAVAEFKPDLIMVSAGFDAHKKDELNYRFIGAHQCQNCQKLPNSKFQNVARLKDLDNTLHAFQPSGQ